MEALTEEKVVSGELSSRLTKSVESLASARAPRPGPAVANHAGLIHAEHVLARRSDYLRRGREEEPKGRCEPVASPSEVIAALVSLREHIVNQAGLR